jgi:hypothetical protein
MKPVPFLCAAVLAISLGCATTLYAETATQSGTSTAQKAPAKKAKAAEKTAARPEGAHATEADAKRACANETVVWVNRASKIYHAGGTRSYGKTRSGFYMCEANAERMGFRPVKAPAPKGKKKDSKKA